MLPWLWIFALFWGYSSLVWGQMGVPYFDVAMKTSIKVFNQNVLSERDRSQCLIFDGHKGMFPCKYLDKSYIKPKSVHKLRPGDIDIVAALGDSITSGTGALAENLFDLGKEYRGVSFASGGLGDWHRFLTLPNIIKNFNPSLKGMSLDITESYSGAIDGFNMAQAGTKTFNLSSQAKKLVSEMRGNPNVDFKHDWKMVTVLVGHNDLCSVVCEKKEFESKTETANVAEALDILYYDLPRTFINLMPIADLSQLFELERLPLACVLLRKWLCPCLFSPIQRNRLNKRKVIIWLNQYALMLNNLVASGRYNKKDDFTVVIQPTLIQGSVPIKDGILDLEFLGPDCFHFSQRTHALIARGLWNNLIQPVGQKSFDYNITVPFLCPSKERPYLATSKNGKSNTSSELLSNKKDFISLMGTTLAQSTLCPI